jgi:hypothetical protein
MVKLTEILQDILAEKKLCPKGKAYYNRRRAAGEKPSAYLSGRAVKVCKGLMEEGEYDDTSKFNLVKQNPFDIKKLVNKGIIFITKPGNGQGGVEEPNWEGDASVITLYNMANAEPWMEEAVKTPLPQAIPHIQNDQDNLLYDGKYNQILWGIKKKGLKPEDFYLNVNESLRDWFKKEDDLNEAKQVGILYHYTENWLLEQIIESNTLQAPVSFTRSKDKKTVSWLGAECSLAIDGDKLSNNYKISPYRDNDGEGNPFDEMEERVNKDITNLNKYIIKVILYEFNPEIESLLKEKNIPYELNLDESLRDWFKKEDWVRIDTAGNITGPCGTMKKGNKTTRCLPRAKANSLSKAERAATSKKKAASDKQFVPNTKKAKVKLNK